MESAEVEPVKTGIELESKRHSFLHRLRRSITSVFRRKPNRPRNKSLSQVPDQHTTFSKQSATQSLSSSLTNMKGLEASNKVAEVVEVADTVDPLKTNFRPLARVPIFTSDLTKELKQSLKLRSKSFEGGDKSPADAIQEMENMRALELKSKEKSNINIDTKTITFEEKVAIFENQITGGSEEKQKKVKEDSESLNKENINKSEGVEDEMTSIVEVKGGSEGKQKKVKEDSESLNKEDINKSEGVEDEMTSIVEVKGSSEGKQKKVKEDSESLNKEDINKLEGVEDGMTSIVEVQEGTLKAENSKDVERTMIADVTTQCRDNNEKESGYNEPIELVEEDLLDGKIHLLLKISSDGEDICHEDITNVLFGNDGNLGGFKDEIHNYCLPVENLIYDNTILNE